MAVKASCLILLLAQVVSVVAWTSLGELNVRNFVFDSTKYHRHVRPANVMTCQVGLSLISINDLNMAEQSMSLTGWLTVEWEDDRLTWTKASYNDVDHIYAGDKDIWKPEIFIDNAVSEVSILQDDNVLFRVTDVGKVDWELPNIFYVSCTIDPTYYPFDTQACAVDVTSWAYTVEELTLTHLRSEVNIEDLGINGEWIYVRSEVSTSQITETTATGVDKFSLLKFTVLLERRYSFYLTNIVLPVLLISLLIILTFILPVDSGEKVSYALTILLALAVLLTLIADSMPNTSLFTSVLSVYLTFTMALGVVTTGLTVIVLRIHHKDPEDPVPVWLRKMTHRFFARVGCWNGCCGSKGDKSRVHVAKDVNGTEANDEEPAAQLPAYPSYSWVQIAAIFDRFLFVVFLFLTCFMALIFMVVLKVGGHVAGNAL